MSTGYDRGKGDAAGVAKRPRERSPTESLRFATFSSLYGGEGWAPRRWSDRHTQACSAVLVCGLINPLPARSTLSLSTASEGEVEYNDAIIQQGIEAIHAQGGQQGIEEIHDQILEVNEIFKVTLLTRVVTHTLLPRTSAHFFQRALTTSLFSPY